MRPLLCGRLSPVGEPIELRRQAPDNLPLFADDYRALLLNSGTAALSLAMSLAASHADIEGGQVILPAYGCPDLLAAAIYAGLVPVLVDIEPDSPRFQMQRLAAAVGEKTVAIVAVNFLGISEDLAALRTVLDGRKVLLIEDCAQYLPVQPRLDNYSGDLVIHSFGRGKPISQLGGGALLAAPFLHDALSKISASLPQQDLDEKTWCLRARLFNLVLQPRYYQFLLMLPQLHIGATRYHPLETIAILQPWRQGYLQGNFQCYRQRTRWAQQQLDKLIESLSDSGLINLPRRLHCQHQPLLRYPLLCPSEVVCDHLYQALLQQGLGVSRMYERPLAEIEGIPLSLQGDFSGATAFARRLLTLPVTSFVDQRRLDAIGTILRSSTAGI